MSNTTVQAAVECLPVDNISRRAVLGGLAAATALTTATAPAIATEHPDAELIRLDKEMGEAHARMMAIGKELDAASDRLEALKSRIGDFRMPEPEPVPAEFRDIIYGEFLSVAAAHTLEKVAPDHPLLAWEREQIEKRREAKAKQDAMFAHLSSDDARVKAVEASYDESFGEVRALADRIFALPAHTFEGIAIKLRAGKRLEADELGDDEAFASIVADIGRLTGAAS